MSQSDIKERSINMTSASPRFTGKLGIEADWSQVLKDTLQLGNSIQYLFSSLKPDCICITLNLLLNYFNPWLAAEMEAGEESMDVQGAAAEPSVSGHSQAKEKPVWASLQEAAQMKTEGNTFYQEKNIRSAIGRYHRALLVLRAIDASVLTSVKGFAPDRPALTPEQESALRNIQVDCYNNLAGR